MARGDRADSALGGEEIAGSVMRIRGELVEGIVGGYQGMSPRGCLSGAGYPQSQRSFYLARRSLINQEQNVAFAASRLWC